MLLLFCCCYCYFLIIVTIIVIVVAVIIIIMIGIVIFLLIFLVVFYILIIIVGVTAAIFYYVVLILVVFIIIGAAFHCFVQSSDRTRIKAHFRHISELDGHIQKQLPCHTWRASVGVSPGEPYLSCSRSFFCHLPHTFSISLLVVAYVFYSSLAPFFILTILLSAGNDVFTHVGRT